MNFVRSTVQWFTNVLNKLMVRSKVVPEHPVNTLEIDLNKPTFYISQLNSYADIAALRSTCLKLGLPDPQQHQQIGNHKIPL